MEEKKSGKTVTFEYKVSPKYSVYAVNGVHGGLTPKGEILMNVFFERHSIPEEITHELNPNGVLGRQVGRKHREAIVRDVAFGLSMTAETARSVAKWLNDRADDFDRLIVPDTRQATKQ